MLSIISPVYQAEDLVEELVQRIFDQVPDVFEIVLVDDGSRDGSWGKIAGICERDYRVRGIRLSRNFGQHAAIAAGLEAAQGEWMVIMDCDLQDRPEEIPALYRKAMEGWDVVLARRVERKDSLFARVCSKAFYRVLSFLSGVKCDSSVANFGIYHRKVVQAMLLVQSSLRYFPAMVNWVGFKKTSIAVEHAERPRGKSSYNFCKKFGLAFNIMLSYSDKFLKIIVGLGMLIAALAFFFAIGMAYQALMGNVQVSGYASLIVSISFFSGAIIFVLGILGLYMGKILESTKAKPSYIINDTV